MRHSADERVSDQAPAARSHDSSDTPSSTGPAITTARQKTMINPALRSGSMAWDGAAALPATSRASVFSESPAQACIPTKRTPLSGASLGASYRRVSARLEGDPQPKSGRGDRGSWQRTSVYLPPSSSPSCPDPTERRNGRSAGHCSCRRGPRRPTQLEGPLPSGRHRQGAPTTCGTRASS